MSQTTDTSMPDALLDPTLRRQSRKRLTGMRMLYLATLLLLLFSVVRVITGAGNLTAAGTAAAALGLAVPIAMAARGRRAQPPAPAAVPIAYPGIHTTQLVIRIEAGNSCGRTMSVAMVTITSAIPQRSVSLPWRQVLTTIAVEKSATAIVTARKADADEADEMARGRASATVTACVIRMTMKAPATTLSTSRRTSPPTRAWMNPRRPAA